MKYRAIVFDLDGTLLDTLADLADSMNAVLEREGYAPHPVDAYRYFVGDGMEMLARRALGVSAGGLELVQRCMAGMEVEYGRRWRRKTCPYPGVPAMLDGVAAAGLAKAVFSNKPDRFTQLAVAEFLGAWRFHAVRGARPDCPRKPDPAGALAIAGELGIPPAQIAYVGDTDTDMHTANAAGMVAIGAAWGFRPAEELVAAGAAWVIEQPPALLERLL